MKEKVCEEPGVFGEWSAFEGLLGELCDHTQGIELLGAARSGTKGNLGRQEGRPVLVNQRCRTVVAGHWSWAVGKEGWWKAGSYGHQQVD